MLLAGIRHRRRRAATVRAGLAAAAVAAVVAAAGISLAIGSGGAQPSGTVRPQAAPQTTHVQLDGYLLTLPAGVSVQKVGAGYVARGRAGAFMIFLESGPSVGPRSSPGGLEPVPVQAGSKSGWWLGSSKGGELWLSEPSLPAREFLVAKVFDLNESQVLAFAVSLNLSAMPVVPVPTTGG